MKQFEFFVMLLMFGGGFSVFIYLGFRAIWSLITDKSERSRAVSAAKNNPGSAVFSLICFLFVIVLFGWLTTSLRK